jgi:CRP-like cAMP-binding protein
MTWPLLAGLPEERMRHVLGVARRRRFERGEVIFHEDDPADTLHLIRSGRVAVRVAAARGDSAILAVLGEGRMFGEIALLEEFGARTASIVTLEPTETVSIHRLDLARLRKDFPEVDEAIIASLAGQVKRLSQQLVEALYVPADKRVLRRLSDMALLYADGAERRNIVVPLTQDHLADLAGTSRITVNRTLRAEQERGVLDLGRGKTIVHRLDELVARAFGGAWPG